MLSEALRLPYRAGDATGTLLVGAGLTALTGIAVSGWLGVLLLFPRIGAIATPLVVLFTLVVRGYLVRVVAAGITATPEAPSFVRWGSLLRNGVQSVLLSVVYALPGLAFGGLAVGAATIAVLSPPWVDSVPQALVAAAIMVGGLGVLYYAFIYLYVRGAARAVLAATGSVRSALAVRQVFTVARSGSYLGGWLMAMGLLLLTPIVLFPVVTISVIAGGYDPVITVIGILGTGVLGVILWFSLRMSAAWATGRGAAPVLATTDSLAVSTDCAVEATPADDTTIPDRGSEAPPQVQAGRPVHPPAPTEQPTAAADTDGGRMDFGMPEPTPADKSPATTDSETAAETATTADPQEAPDAIEVDDISNTVESAGDEPMTVDGITTAEEIDAADEPTATAEEENEASESDADGEFEWGEVEES